MEAKGKYFVPHQVGLIQKKNDDIITGEVNVEDMGEKNIHIIGQIENENFKQDWDLADTFNAIPWLPPVSSRPLSIRTWFISDLKIIKLLKWLLLNEASNIMAGKPKLCSKCHGFEFHLCLWHPFQGLCVIPPPRTVISRKKEHSCSSLLLSPIKPELGMRERGSDPRALSDGRKWEWDPSTTLYFTLPEGGTEALRSGKDTAAPFQPFICWLQVPGR